MMKGEVTESRVPDTSEDNCLTEDNLWIDVVIPAHNAGRYLKEAVDSVLLQDYEFVRCYVFDNNSTDGSADFLSDSAYERVTSKASDVTLPPNESWTTASMLGTSPYLMLLCADDLLARSALTQKATLLHSFGVGKGDIPSAVISRRGIIIEGCPTLLSRLINVFFGLIMWLSRSRLAKTLDGKPLNNYRIISRRKTFATTLSEKKFLDQVSRGGGNFIGEPVTVMMNRKQLLGQLPWSSTAGYVIDLDMWFRLLSNNVALWTTELSGFFRIQSGSWTSRIAEKQDDELTSWLEAERRLSYGDEERNLPTPRARFRLRGKIRRAIYANFGKK